MEVWKMMFIFQLGDFSVPAVHFPGVYVKLLLV